MGNKESQIATTTLLRDKLKENVARITWLALNNISGYKTNAKQSFSPENKLPFYYVQTSKKGCTCVPGFIIVRLHID